jgi:hypothetical protein
MVSEMTETTTQKEHEQNLETLMNAVTEFEADYEASTTATGHEMDENHLFEKEFWVEGLIEAPDCLNIKVGGWFTLDKETQRVSVRLSIYQDGEAISDTQALMAQKSPESAWGELRYEPM